MVANPFLPQKLVGRQVELRQMIQILTSDDDLLVAGVPGSGRRTLVRWAAQRIGAHVIEIDCLRATDPSRFLRLLAEGILSAFDKPAERVLIQRWSINYPVILEQPDNGRPRLVWHLEKGEEWTLLQVLLALPQVMAEWLDCRVVVMFQNFLHIRSWDRSGKWEHYLCQEIDQQTRVSYALIATTAESLPQTNTLQVVTLPPLPDDAIAPWIVEAMQAEGMKFEKDALALFLQYVQGHFGDAIALARRLCLDLRALLGQDILLPKQESTNLPSWIEIQAHHVHRTTLMLVEDLSLTFESLILLLPPSQVRVLESLALDPTDSPHSREYIQKHQLSRGGGLQGALASLEQKGLVYGPHHGYRITMPLLAFWLRQRLG